MFVPALALLALWQGHQRDELELLDVRTALAAIIASCAKCVAQPDRLAILLPHELATLTGTTDVRRTRAALRRLHRVGLPLDVLCAPKLPTELLLPLVSTDITAIVENHRRRVPVPRRLVRFLARYQRPAVLAVAFAHLLRGLYYRNDLCVSGGTCKASWISDVFGIDLRTAKSARRLLVEIGFVLPMPTPQKLLNRFGQRFQINLAWSAPDARQ